MEGEVLGAKNVIVDGQSGVVGSHGLLGKENMYDHSCRVPLIVKAPQLPAGKGAQSLSSHSDLMPTLCSLAGVAIPIEDMWHD